MSTLVNRNVLLANRRTSLRLEPAMWEALEEVCRREGITIHDVSAMVDSGRSASTLTAAIRVFVLGYFRRAATETGHARAGHGRLVGLPIRRAIDRAGASGRAGAAAAGPPGDRPGGQGKMAPAPPIG